METACRSRLLPPDHGDRVRRSVAYRVPSRESQKLGCMTARHFLLICVAALTSWAMLGRACATDATDNPGTSKALVGTQLTYHVRYKSEGYTDIRNAIKVAPEGHSPPRHNLLGSLEVAEILTFLDGDRGVVRASIRFKGPVITIQVDSRSQPGREREIAESLGRTATAYFDAQGRVTRLEFPKEYSPMAANFVKSIITMQQFAVPSSLGRSASIWDMEETGANGRYAAHYQVTGMSGPLTRVTKTLAKSASPLASDGANSATNIQIVPQGKIEISVNRDQRVVRDLDGVSREEMLVQGHVLASQSTTIATHIVSSVRLSQTDLATATRMLAIPGAMDALNRPAHGLTPAQERAMQQQVLGSDSLHSLLGALADIDGGTASQDHQMSLYLKLKALVYLDPGASRSLGSRLLVADPTSASTQLITTALSAVGSSEAQDALCQMIRAKKEDFRALPGLVPILGSLHQPTERVVLLLQELSRSSSRDIRSMALLGLGGAAKNLAPVSPKRSSAIVGDLARQYSSSTTVDEQTTLLLALGNSGSERAEGIILSQRNNQSPELRRIAFAALGGFKSNASLQALCETLSVDQDPRVRSAAAQALAPRNKINVAEDALLHAAQQDVAESVRLASLFALTDLIPRDERVREIVSALAEGDGSAAVREQATSLLQRRQPEK